MIEAGSFSIFGDWDNSPTPDGTLRIVMPPLGHVSGAGWQPWTQAALNALAATLKPGDTFFDLGAGSGILSVAAKSLGAGKCWASELDRDALAVMPEVFAANRVDDVEVIDGTFLPPDVVPDVTIVSIATGFYEENVDRIRGRVILVVEDDATVTTYKEAA